jgi:hypothetical protein
MKFTCKICGLQSMVDENRVFLRCRRHLSELHAAIVEPIGAKSGGTMELSH